MCLILMGLWFILLYYADAQLAALQLTESYGREAVQVSQGWEIVMAVWPLGLLLFVSGALVVLLSQRLQAFRRYRKTRSTTSGKL